MSIFVPSKKQKDIFFGGKKGKKKSVSKKTTVQSQVTAMVSKLLPPVEKKRTNITFSSNDYSIGQVAGNSNGYLAVDITPLINQGANVSDRIGNLVNVTSLHMTLQMRQMSACVSPVKIIVYLWYAKGLNDQTPGFAVNDLYNTNNYLGSGNQVIDTGSDLNIDNLGAYRMLKKYICYMKPDGFSGQQMPEARTFGLKFKTPLKLRYNGTGGTNISQGRMFLFAFSSCGNASSSVVSTVTNSCVQAINTGQLINYNIKYYYTDV